MMRRSRIRPPTCRSRLERSDRFTVADEAGNTTVSSRIPDKAASSAAAQHTRKERKFVHRRFMVDDCWSGNAPGAMARLEHRAVLGPLCGGTGGTIDHYSCVVLGASTRYHPASDYDLATVAQIANS